MLYVSCDSTGTPMKRQEPEGRRGKQTDGSSKTLEVKLGAIFTQHVVDEGRAIAAIRNSFGIPNRHVSPANKRSVENPRWHSNLRLSIPFGFGNNSTRENRHCAFLNSIRKRMSIAFTMNGSRRTKNRDTHDLR